MILILIDPRERKVSILERWIKILRFFSFFLFFFFLIHAYFPIVISQRKFKFKQANDIYDT